MKKEEFKKWWDEHKRVVGMVTGLSVLVVGGCVAYIFVDKHYSKRAKEIIKSVRSGNITDLPKPDIKGVYIHDFWCENAAPGSGMGVKAIIAVDPEVADVGKAFETLAKAGNVDTKLNGFWATVEWDCND